MGVWTCFDHGQLTDADVEDAKESPEGKAYPLPTTVCKLCRRPVLPYALHPRPVTPP